MTNKQAALLSGVIYTAPYIGMDSAILFGIASLITYVVCLVFENTK